MLHIKTCLTIISCLAFWEAHAAELLQLENQLSKLAGTRSLAAQEPQQLYLAKVDNLNMAAIKWSPTDRDILAGIVETTLIPDRPYYNNSLISGYHFDTAPTFVTIQSSVATEPANKYFPNQHILWAPSGEYLSVPQFTSNGLIAYIPYIYSINNRTLSWTRMEIQREPVFESFFSGFWLWHNKQYHLYNPLHNDAFILRNDIWGFKQLPPKLLLQKPDLSGVKYIVIDKNYVFGFLTIHPDYKINWENIQPFNFRIINSATLKVTDYMLPTGATVSQEQDIMHADVRAQGSAYIVAYISTADQNTLCLQPIFSSKEGDLTLMSSHVISSKDIIWNDVVWRRGVYCDVTGITGNTVVVYRYDPAKLTSIEQHHWILQGHGNILQLDWNADGSLFAVVFADGYLGVYKAPQE
jgi:hypothetical protein